MTGERPFEIVHIPARLRGDFTGRIAEAAHGTPEERERNFLTRALAGFAVHKLGGADLPNSAAAVVDGAGDGGIDAFYYSANAHTLWLVQSKYFESGRGEPDLGDVSKFCNGAENLLRGRFEAFGRNAAWAARLPQLTTQLQDAALSVRAVLVYSGINLVSDDRLRLFENLQGQFHPHDDYFSFSPYNLTSIHDWLLDEQETTGVAEIQLDILNPGWFTQPFETIYGQVRLSDLAQLQRAHGGQLIAANIRGFVGATEVNEQIVKTLRETPERFFFLNNGITAYCDRLEINNLDRADPVRKRVRAIGFSVVNGAQTLGSIHNAFGSTIPGPESGFVFIKIVSLERCEDDQEFSREITRCSNFQNQIGVRDFAALDEQQERIAAQLRLSGINYHFKRSEEVPSPDETNLTLEEATTALACLNQESACDSVSRILSDRKSLWSMDQVFPAGELYRTRYHRIFRPDRSARTIWRAVQTQRVVVAKMQTDGRVASGVRESFHENSRWLALNLIFLRLHPERGESLQLTQEEINSINADTILVCDALWNSLERLGHVTRRVLAGVETHEAVRHLRSVFCAAADCSRLRGVALAALAPNGGAGP